MKKAFAHIVTFVLMLAPLAAGAADSPGGLIPCGATDPGSCDFAALLQLIQNVINYLILISIPLAALSFAYAGWLYITSGGNSGQVSKAHGIFTKVLIGFVCVLAAWLIVKAITTALLDSSFDTLG